jgi:formylglycine-generating enzyme required for sulfatase activity
LRALGTAKLTRTGTVLGTPAYMSPKQIQGTKLDHRTDIYSVGTMFYEMLTGRVPFERPKDSDSDYPVLEAHMHQAPTPPSQLVPEIPPFLEDAILKALAKRPQDRFASCEEFQVALAPAPLPVTKPIEDRTASFTPEEVKLLDRLAEQKAQQERLAREKEERERAERDRLAREKAEAEEKVQQEQLAKARRDHLAREEAARKLAEEERIAREKAEKDRKEKRRRAVVVSLLASVIVIVAGLAWPYWPHAPAPRRQVRENPKDGLKYVWIPAGSFTMGCSRWDFFDCSPDEKPSHEVTISKGFWIGQTEVTVGAYRRFGAATKRQMPEAPYYNRGWANDRMPIVNVNWDEARDYCTWAGGRLPTEAEWEYAARGGSTQARYGNIDEIAWYTDNSGNRAHEVAQKPANDFGLFDMLGNAWEWVNDWDDVSYYDNSPPQDPAGPTSGREHVLRGGSWLDYPRLVRVSLRDWGDPAGRSNNNGFRCGGQVFNP